MGFIYVGIILFSVIVSYALDRPIGASLTQGAQSGITLALSISGSLCLWSGVGHLMEYVGLTAGLGRLMGPILRRIFPSSKSDPLLLGNLSSNVCANLLGLGNSATPMGVQAAKRLRDPNRPHLATGELCRLIVLNTASIQLIPSNVAALRSSFGCRTPFDILIPVWITSFASAGLGVFAAWLLERVWHHE